MQTFLHQAVLLVVTAFAYNSLYTGYTGSHSFNATLLLLCICNAFKSGCNIAWGITATLLKGHTGPPSTKLQGLGLPRAEDDVYYFWQVEEGEQEDNAEERAIRETDDHVGRIYSALLSDTLLMVCSCQGDTASSRMLYVSLL